MFDLSNEVLQKEYIYLVTDYWTTNKEGNFCKNGIHNPKKTLTIAYYFPDSNHVKLYFPNELENKWYSNCSIQDVFGKYKLDYYKTISNRLVITKSQKDRIFLDYHYNIPAIATQNEGSYFDPVFIDELKGSFNEIYVLYDNDEAGIAASINISQKYGLDRLELNAGKDIYEMTQKKGKAEIKKELIKLWKPDYVK